MCKYLKIAMITFGEGFLRFQFCIEENFYQGYSKISIMFILGIKINTLFERKTFIKYRSNREEKYICAKNR